MPSCRPFLHAASRVHAGQTTMRSRGLCQDSRHSANRRDYGDSPRRAVHNWRLHRLRAREAPQSRPSLRKTARLHSHRAGSASPSGLQTQISSRARSSIDRAINDRTRGQAPDEARPAMRKLSGQGAHKSGQTRHGQKMAGHLQRADGLTRVMLSPQPFQGRIVKTLHTQRNAIHPGLRIAARRACSVLVGLASSVTSNESTAGKAVSPPRSAW